MDGWIKLLIEIQSRKKKQSREQIETEWMIFLSDREAEKETDIEEKFLN